MLGYDPPVACQSRMASLIATRMQTPTRACRFGPVEARHICGRSFFRRHRQSVKEPNRTQKAARRHAHTEVMAALRHCTARLLSRAGWCVFRSLLPLAFPALAECALELVPVGATNGVLYCYSVVTVLLQCCPSVVTVLSQCCYRVVTVLLP
jgi:hypothetical protein